MKYVDLPDAMSELHDAMSELHLKMNALAIANLDLRDRLLRIEETINKADKTIATIAAEVKPTIDAAMNHPMAKMFGLNKR